jgi:glycosyltransferase involved in cell wall biosynthesis
LINIDSAPKIFREKTDAFVIGGWNYTAAWEALLSCKLRGIPVVFLSENLRQRTELANTLASWIVPQFDACLAASSGAKENLVRLGADDEEVTVLPYCIDVDAFQAGIDEEGQQAIRKQYDIDSTDVVLYVGLLTERKGVGDLISAVDGLDPKSTHLLIVGEGPEREKLEKQAAAVDVPTTFTGNVPNQELANYYALASAFVLPSREEPWGLVQNEALACGTPVVTTTASGAVGDLVIDGENGLVVSPEAPDQLRKAITSLLQNPERRHEMAQNGLERTSQFTPDIYAEQIKTTIDRVISLR